MPIYQGFLFLSTYFPPMKCYKQKHEKQSEATVLDLGYILGLFFYSQILIDIYIYKC